MDENVVLHSWDDQARLVGPGLNSPLTLLIHRRDSALHFDVGDCGAAPHARVGDTIMYMRHLHAIAVAVDPAAAADAPSFLFQTDDNPVDCSSASWESRKDWSSITLVPDIYYYMALGYETFLPTVVPWEQRDDRLLWRGSTTGILGLTENNLDVLPRYRLCRLATALGERADCGFTDVVQCRTLEDDLLVRTRLEQEGLTRAYIQVDEMQNARYAIDIDGNANSWNFIQRLRIGACMLRVESEWQQWFEPRLVRWEHYVPIKADMSDLIEKMDWCGRNERAASDIAAAGRNFAMQMRYSDELAAAGRELFSAHDD